MTTRKERFTSFDRRNFLRSLATGAAAACAAGVARAADDQLLDTLIEQNQRGEFGQGFDSASRTIKTNAALRANQMSSAHIPDGEVDRSAPRLIRRDRCVATHVARLLQIA